MNSTTIETSNLGEAKVRQNQPKNSKIGDTIMADLNDIDTLIEELTPLQFSILTWVACGKSPNQITSILDIDPESLESELNEIVEQFAVPTLEAASQLYQSWIDYYETELR